MSEEQKRNYQKDLDRFEEEKFAAKNSFPTKLLGWMLIASIGIQIAGAISGNNYDLGGLVFLFIGIAVLKGSQIALRLATFFVVPGAAIGLLHIIWTVARNEPLEVGHEWNDYRDLEFWTLGVSPCMYFAAESIVAACALRLRKIPFWTKTVRLWAAAVGVLLLLQFGFFARDLIRQSEVRRSLSRELAAVRAQFLGATKSAEATFSEFPNIVAVRWSGSRNSYSTIYHKKANKGAPSGEHLFHQEWLQLPSGAWGRIDMKVILPEKP
ncbi:MAG: hypothetical protein EOP83_15865 [Verrucomicrobiaceae bacterium]|nr:MAG: hypothetical protein EOP83_15865 [Verrucomicrobiaceae bacterium]